MSVSIEQGIAAYLVIASSVTVHEWAHAISADWLGDNTPRSQGRTTLDPLAHLDPIGTFAIPLFMIFFSPGLAILGWGKPVQFNPSNFPPGKRKLSIIVTAMAGPFSNLVICLGAAVVGGIALRFAPHAKEQIDGMFFMIIALNCLLVVFNMMPIPPLDGSHLLRLFVGMSEETHMRLSRYGLLFLLILINTPIYGAVVGPTLGALAAPFLILMQLIGG